MGKIQKLILSKLFHISCAPTYFLLTKNDIQLAKILLLPKYEIIMVPSNP